MVFLVLLRRRNMEADQNCPSGKAKMFRVDGGDAFSNLNRRGHLKVNSKVLASGLLLLVPSSLSELNSSRCSSASFETRPLQSHKTRAEPGLPRRKRP